LNVDELSYRVTIHTCLPKASRRNDVIEAFMSDLRAAMRGTLQSPVDELVPAVDAGLEHTCFDAGEAVPVLHTGKG
jgi:hypothetical protein